MKKHFESKKPVAVLFTSGMYGDRKIVVPFATEKKLIDAMKEPFMVIEKGCFFLGQKIVPSAIKGGAPTSQNYGGSYTNNVLIRTNQISEVGIVHDGDDTYDSFSVAYDAIMKNESEQEQEKKEEK